MAISDKSISADQERLARTYGDTVLQLNPSDQAFITANGYVTGSDVLNTDVWREYRINNEIADGFEWDVKEYISILSKLGIIGLAAVELKDREARDLKAADEVAYRQVFAGKAIFTSDSDLKGVQSEEETVVAQTYADLSASIKAEFDRKMIEEEFILDLKRKSDDHTYYIRVKEGRDVAKRSMRAQGFRINDQDMRVKNNPAGTRGRFNVFNDRHPSRYASGSWKSGSNSGPRVQGPGGGVGSCKFVIINRSGSL